MANYDEIRGLFDDSGLTNRLTVAIVVAAESVRVEDVTTANHAERLTWAKNAFANPEPEAKRALKSLVASNKSMNITAIKTVSDTAIQSQVNTLVNMLAGV